MWPGMTPAMKRSVLMIASVPGPATRRTEMGGPGMSVFDGVNKGRGEVQKMFISVIRSRSSILELGWGVLMWV